MLFDLRVHVLCVLCCWFPGLRVFLLYCALLRVFSVVKCNIYTWFVAVCACCLNCCCFCVVFAVCVQCLCGLFGVSCGVCLCLCCWCLCLCVLCVCCSCINVLCVCVCVFVSFVLLVVACVCVSDRCWLANVYDVMLFVFV